MVPGSCVVPNWLSVTAGSRLMIRLSVRELYRQLRNDWLEHLATEGFLLTTITFVCTMRNVTPTIPSGMVRLHVESYLWQQGSSTRCPFDSQSLTRPASTAAPETGSTSKETSKPQPAVVRAGVRASCLARAIFACFMIGALLQ